MSIIYIKNDKIFKKTDDTITKLEEIYVDKHDIITSSLDLKNTISFTFKLPKSTPEDQLYSYAEMHFYENAGLDLNKEYVIHFIIKELEQEESYLIEAIAADKNLLQEEFSSIVEKTKYIDFISFMPFTFESFYKLYNKKPKRDAFIYLDDNYSFINVFENGKYVYSKTMTSLNSLLKSIQLEEKEFIEILKTKGLDKDSYEADEFLLSSEIDQFFSKYFMDVNNRLSYGANIFYLEAIENIYFYTPFKIKGIESLKSFWELNNINFEIISPSKEINLLDKLAIIYNEENYDSNTNFSIFPRPEPFYKTRTFLLSSILTLSISSIIAHYTYTYFQINSIKQEKTHITKQIKQLKNKVDYLNKKNKNIIQEVSKYKKQISKIESQIKKSKKLLENSLEILNNPKTYQDFVKLSKLLQKNNLKVLKMSKENNQFTINVYTKAKHRDKIAMFMHDLIKSNYQNVSSEYVKELEGNYYISEIRFSK